MLNAAVKMLKSMYSFVIKLIVAAGIFLFQSCQNIGNIIFVYDFVLTNIA